MDDQSKLTDPYIPGADEFPVLEQGVYANHAALAPWPKSVSEAVHQFADENYTVGPARYKTWVTRERRLKESLALMTGAESWKDIALLKNTTEGICVVSEGIDWKPGDNIVIPDGEFPSNRLPWLAQQRHGVEIREIDVRSTPDPEAALINAMDRRTRVMSVSAIAWDDGLVLSLDRLGEACAQTDTLFFVDAIQRLGMLPIDVQASQIDCLSADAHKWLLGPEGISVFYCNEKTRPQLRLRQLGWYMVDYPWAFDRQGLEPSTSARRFEAGSPNSLGQAAFDASVNLLLGQGMDCVSGQVMKNTRMLLEGLMKIDDIEITSPLAPDRQSAIVCFKPSGLNCKDFVKKLAEAKVVAAERGGSVRLSLHYYQGRDEVEAVLEGIKKTIE
jgi:selenocysteine lyase/cysteine desulfurase